MMTIEQKKKISETMKRKGIKPPVFKGMKFTEKHKKNLSLAAKGRKPWNKGIKIDRKKYPKMGHHKKHTPETKEKMKKNHKGTLGKKYSLISRKRMSIAQKKVIKPCGEKAPNWQGGKSFEPYSVDWIETLRRSIRERDKYTCQLCGKQQGDRAFDIHHIDYDKMNSNPNNLITLCRCCHLKTNHNRKFWLAYFSHIRGTKTNNI